MANLLPSVFNKETGQWESIIARPVAQEVFKIMKEDYLKSKGQLDYILLTNENDSNMDINVVLFYDSSKKDNIITQDKEKAKHSLEIILDTYMKNINNNAKQFKISEFRTKLIDQGWIPEEMKLNATVTEDTGGGNKDTHEIPSFNELTAESTIINALFNAGSTIDVRYFYNGNPIEDYKFSREVTEENKEHYPSELQE